MTGKCMMYKPNCFPSDVFSTKPRLFVLWAVVATRHGAGPGFVRAARWRAGLILLLALLFNCSFCAETIFSTCELGQEKASSL